MTIGYGTVSTPLGDLLAISSDGSLVRLAFPEEDHEGALEAAADHLGGPLRRRVPALLETELAGYFAGRLRSFSVPWTLSLVPEGFGRRVLERTAEVPYGAVATYGEIAARAGSPRGARAAGNALNANPIPIVVPCHRIVPADGGIGGYGGREDRKETLLRLEGAVRPRSLPRGA